MYRIASIEITGFQGKQSPIKLPMDSGVNFFIGRNGTGKTRLMNLLNSALTADIPGLARSDFEVITFTLSKKGERARPYLRIERGFDDEETPYIFYRIAQSSRGEAQEFRFDTDSYRAPWRRAYLSRYDESGRGQYIDETHSHTLRSTIHQMVRLSWISVHRATTDSPREGERKFESPVDRKLDQVARDFGAYFSTLDKLAAEETDRFQQVYLLSLISPAGFEKISNLKSVNADDEKAAIRGMFAEFNIKSSVYSKKLDTFSARMEKALADYKPHESMDADDFLVLNDTVRIHDAVGEWHRLLEKRAAIYAPKDDFVKIVNDMFYRKSLSINPGNQPVFHSPDGLPIDIQLLSSGEKQLFILLGETLLQRQRECVFMADEPELSLHIDWQERLVPSLRLINPNAQIIFATHSPDVVGAYGSNTIDLEKVI